MALLVVRIHNKLVEVLICFYVGHNCENRCSHFTSFETEFVQLLISVGGGGVKNSYNDDSDYNIPSPVIVVS